ncbi:MAG: GNAT family N-acetyltransferase [Sphingobacteriaceae bacterium]|nr:GNAT family N-acetyltransferase [Sphingobacteriaceae bacterium]
MLIRYATVADIPVIHQLAHLIWPDTYKSILPTGQIDFMLTEMYSLQSLKKQINEGVHFIIAELEEKPVGFASFSLSEEKSGTFIIHKLYLLTELQGKGIGSELLNFIKEEVILKGGKALTLNVNRNNPAVRFYQKYGFMISDEADLIYHRFVLNDYIMSMQL